jgi:hypothetical protein
MFVFSYLVLEAFSMDFGGLNYDKIVGEWVVRRFALWKVRNIWLHYGCFRHFGVHYVDSRFFIQ